MLSNVKWVIVFEAQLSRGTNKHRKLGYDDAWFEEPKYIYCLLMVYNFPTDCQYTSIFILLSN